VKKKRSGKKNFLNQWNRIRPELKDSRLCLFLDFDGTLTPIRKHPRMVKLSTGTRRVLQELAADRGVYVAIVSGRDLGEVRKLVGVKDLVYVGNHGFEAKGPKFSFAVPGALKAKGTMKEISRKLQEAFKPFKGVYIEDKGLSLSVHFRMVKKKRDLAEVKMLFGSVIVPYKFRSQIRVTPGKKVWEIRPPVDWDKGTMVLRLLDGQKKKARKKITPFYIGDDRTDEDVFKRMGKDAYTIRVGSGKKQTSARYYLKNVTEVKALLRKVLVLRKEA